MIKRTFMYSRFHKKKKKKREIGRIYFKCESHSKVVNHTHETFILRHQRILLPHLKEPNTFHMNTNTTMGKKKKEEDDTMKKLLPKTKLILVRS